MTGSTSITAASPTRTRAAAASLSAAPMSIQRSSSRAARSRSSSRIRWIALRPITPVTSPPRARMRIRCPISTGTSQPPMPRNARVPSPLTWVTISPISSMWPQRTTFFAPGATAPRSRAIVLPFTSGVTSAQNFAASARQTRAAAIS